MLLPQTRQQQMRRLATSMLSFGIATTMVASDLLPNSSSGVVSPSATRETTNATATRAAASTSNEQWRVFLGLAILVASYVFRVELMLFLLRLARRAVPGAFVWLKEFEKNLLHPLSWVVFILLLWLAVYVMDLSNVLHLESGTLTSIITLVLGFPLIWVVISLCNYITWGIIRVKGWNRAASKDDDDYSRVMIITEGIGVIKILLVATVVSSFMVDEIGQITDFDSAQISTVAVLMVELVFVFGAHSWLKNIMGGLMALLDEQIRSGSHIRFDGHEGVVERLHLQCFSVRQYDKGLAYIPNSVLLENAVEILSKRLDRRCVVRIHLSHRTPASMLRLFIQALDSFLLQLHAETRARHKTKAALGLALAYKPRGSGGGSGTSDWDDDVRGAATNARAADDEFDQFDSSRFWIAVDDAYTVDVVYYTQERHIKQIMAEKTEVVLHVTELLTKLQLTLHGADNPAAAASPALSPRHAAIAALQLNATSSRVGRHSVNFAALSPAPSSLPAFDRFRRYRSENIGGMRHRRQQSSAV